MEPIIAINVEEDDEEPLKGRPQTVRLQKTEYNLGQPDGSVTIVADYDADGRISERRVYRPDGTLSFHESFQYEADPRVCMVQILSAQGAVLSTRRILTGPEGEESIVTNPSGEITEKTRTRRDSEGRVIEAILADTIRNKEVRMDVDYREETSVRYRDFSGREHEVPRAGRRTVIQSRDAEGNWTRKTIR